ncbi:pyruvate dehydrogenase complex dihydrolipoamide acetyltransferase [Gulosibacter sp. 10]|uniref:pyruvate dehydrogenase complex dihydrolipoamide acetyltransferase n=1 Tax=Gulosibacter sp. 10 TaxID=1255570 RepID=UPI00097F66B5|nr:pyruvate dehydrogenase complex dihydrolipoamide acetyltransferase [Gulosibacter sp. 10]SJM63888.1 Dihydrolipoamide acetyltransferase component of pyruvate dehydrogenase complex [Gulosibacter sp. 10]
MTTLIKMPQLAAGGDDATIQSWLVSKGDAVEEGQPIAEIETEKAVIEYEAEVGGFFAGPLVEAGETAPVGAVIGAIADSAEGVDAALAEVGGSAAAAEPDGGGATVLESAEPETAEPESAEPGSAEPGSAEPGSAEPDPRPADGAGAGDERIFASPLARKLAKEHGIDVAELSGSGPNGRIVRRDIEAFLDARPAVRPAAPAASEPGSDGRAPREEAAAERSPAPAATGDYEDIPLSGMRRAIARRLTESKTTIPHFYLDASIRVDALLELRAQINEGRESRVSVNDLIVKAVAAAHRAVPAANAVWVGDSIRQYRSVDIAVAVSIPGGLLTPVVRDVESKSVSTLSAEIRDLAARARDGKIRQGELEGSAFSVSNLGMYGTERFSAIINPPQSGILAVGAAQRQPVVSADGGIEAGTVMAVTLSADHRVLDGAVAAEWLAAFVRLVEHPLEILV